jgi:hypothetical protein
VRVNGDGFVQQCRIDAEKVKLFANSINQSECSGGFYLKDHQISINDQSLLPAIELNRYKSKLYECDVQ